MSLRDDMQSYRLAKALSRRSAAAICGVAFSTWARVERGGEYTPNTESAIRALIDPDNWQPKPGSLLDRVRDLERRLDAVERRTAPR